MSVDSKKCQEIQFELVKWARKTVATKNRITIHIEQIAMGIQGCEV